MSVSLPRSEAERTLDDLGQRARVGMAVAVATFIVLLRQAGGAPEELLARGFVIAAAFFVAVLAHELPARLAARRIGLAAGVVADLGAASIAVALLMDDFPLAPVALLWPVFTAGLVAPTLYVLAAASIATIVLFAVVLAHGDGLAGVGAAGGWGLLYLAAGLAHAEILRQFRRAQRTTETALTHAASLSFCTSAEEVGEALFAFADFMLGSSGTPAALLHDERGAGVHLAVAVREIDAEARARLRLNDGASADVLSIVQAGGMWTDPRQLSERLVLAGSLAAARRLFVVPLRDQRRVVGALLVGAPRERVLGEEAQRGLARVAIQAASSLQRIRASRLVEQQRAAMSFLLDVRRAGDDATAIAAWATRAARELTGAWGAAFLMRERGRYRSLAAVEVDGAELVRDAKELLENLFGRQLPVVVADLREDRRFALGPSLASGSLVGVPVHGEGAVLIVRDKRADTISSGQVELLIMLADQAGLLLARARALGHGARRARDENVGEARLSELAARFHDPNAELHARVVESLRLAIEGNQPYLAGSGDRVGRLAVSIAEHLGGEPEENDAIYVAALLRDVGQLGVDRSILERPRALHEEELAVVHQHPLLGETILASVGFLAPAARLVRGHHERYDGAGYPDGAAGEDIPAGARVLAVADAFYAMTSERPHRTAFAPGDAIRTIIDTAGHAFDPDVVQAFVSVVETAARPAETSA